MYWYIFSFSGYYYYYYYFRYYYYSVIVLLSSPSRNTKNIWESQHKFIRWHEKKRQHKNRRKGVIYYCCLPLSLSAICVATAARTATSGPVFHRFLVEYSKAARVKHVFPSQVRLQNPNCNVLFRVIFTICNYQCGVGGNAVFSSIISYRVDYPFKDGISAK
jgi:hypothetical protein